MIIYLDLFLFKNLIFNILIIFLCGKILKRKLNMKRYFFAALFGTTYALIVILIRNSFLMSNVMKIIATIIMILIAYLPSKVDEIFVTCFIFILATSCIGGFLIMIDVEKTFINQFVLITVVGIMICIFMKVYRQQKIFDTYRCKIKINIDNLELKMNAFIDTGNTLKDSLSGESVVFVSMKELEKNLPENLIKILKSEVLEIEEKYYGRIRMIEYQTINKARNILVGIKADNIIVENEKCTIENEKIIIAPTENKFKNYEALIGMNILEEGYVYGNSTSFETQSKKVME
ncbi:MAG: sigma-E processing peptidase SpoIIGA [Clostridia bacterium]|nr:sigma-E processing peptidase SpoIIGA [Clostridia bacterium]